MSSPLPTYIVGWYDNNIDQMKCQAFFIVLWKNIYYVDLVLLITELRFYIIIILTPKTSIFDPSL